MALRTKRNRAIRSRQELISTRRPITVYAINRAHCAVSVYCWNMTILSP
jgi:hypothetical protein